MITKEYQFPKITNKMHEEIAKWYETHNGGKCANGYYGVVGGNIIFEIIPTSLGDFLTIKCSCGEKLKYQELQER